MLGLWAENLVGLVQLRGLDWVFGYCCGACLVKNVCVLRLCVYKTHFEIIGQVDVGHHHVT